MPPLCAALAPVSIRRGDSGTARRTTRAPFRRRQNALIWTITLVSAPDRQAVQIRRLRARPKPRRQSRYVIRLPVVLAGLCRIVHR